MVNPSTVGILLLLLAARATSLRAIFLCIAVAAATATLIELVVRLLKRVALPPTSSAAALLSLGIGSILCSLLTHAFDGVPTVTEPTFAALLLAVGCVAAERSALPLTAYPAAVVIGLLRELLTTGSVWSVPLLSGFGAFADVTGSMLVAAVVFFVFGTAYPVLETVPLSDGLLSAGIPIGAGVLFRLIPLPPLYALWAAVTVAAVAEAVLPAEKRIGAWLVAAPFVLLSENAIPFLVVFAFTILAAAPLVRRLRLLPPLRRFAGVPCTAVITALVRSIVSAVF